MSDKTIELFRECIPLFQLLGDPARQDIILLLAEAEPLTVNQIVEVSELSRPAISHHLKLLRQGGLVKADQQGTSRYFSLTLQPSVSLLKKMIEMIETIEHTCLEN